MPAIIVAGAIGMTHGTFQIRYQVKDLIPRLVFAFVIIVGAMGESGSAVLAVVIGLIIVVPFYLLLVGWFARIAALIVLAEIAPVALVRYALPQTQAVAGVWWRSLLGCLATPVLQAIFFTTGVNQLLDPDSNVAILLGLPAGAPRVHYG